MLFRSLHLAAGLAALVSLRGLPLGLVASGIALSGGWSVADALLRLPSSVCAIELREDGSGRWRDRQGREHAVVDATSSWAGPVLVVLGLRVSRWRTRWVLLLPDSAPADALRRLRVWLKWRPVTA